MKTVRLTEAQLRSVVKRIIAEGYYDRYSDPSDGPDYDYDCQCGGTGQRLGRDGPIVMDCPECDGKGLDPATGEECPQCGGEGRAECEDHPKCNHCGGSIVPGEESEHAECYRIDADYDRY